MKIFSSPYYCDEKVMKSVLICNFFYRNFDALPESIQEKLGHKKKKKHKHKKHKKHKHSDEEPPEEPKKPEHQPALDVPNSQPSIQPEQEPRYVYCTIILKTIPIQFYPSTLFPVTNHLFLLLVLMKKSTNDGVKNARGPKKRGKSKRDMKLPPQLHPPPHHHQHSSNWVINRQLTSNL